MNKQRLLKLAEVLENFQEERKNLVVPLARFDLNTWANGIAMNGALHRKRGCGTTACAVGTATLHPWFRRRGLRMIAEVDRSDWWDTCGPAYRGAKQWAAVQRFFEVDEDVYIFLFTTEAYPATPRGPESVAKRIRAIVASNGVVPS